MAIELISTIKPSSTFPIAESNDIKGGPFSKKTIAERDAIPTEFIQEGTFCYVIDEEMTYQYKNKGWEEFKGGGGAEVPSLEYDSSSPAGKKIYLQSGENLILFARFSSTTYGNCTLRVYKDNILFKTITAPKGTVVMELGAMDVDGTFNYRVSGSDYLGIAAPDDLYFTVVVGGLKLSTTFDETIKNIIEANTEIKVTYRSSSADTTSKIKIYCAVTDSNNSIIKTDTIVTNASSANGEWVLGSLERGSYTLTLQAFTGTSIDDTGDDVMISSQLVYTFNVIGEGELAIVSVMDTLNITEDTAISIPFTCSAKGISRLLMKGKVSKITTLEDGTESLTTVTETPTAGITATVGVTTYWFIGNLPEAKYRYELNAYTLDSQKQSLDPAIADFEVKVGSFTKIEPISTNLLAYFDANDMRNNVENPNIWVNKADTGDRYYIDLFNLNYNTNGWKHVDESLDDGMNGEMMLKFSGDSYGIMMDKNTGKPYCPFSTITTSSTGLTIEVSFRTRCIGEMNSRVITCQNNIDTGTPGISVTHENLWIASDSQSTSLGFAEDEWIHATFVIDKEVRTLADVGLNDIENMNPVPTMNIYINGSLCSSTALINDKFLDANGNSYPFYLNCAESISGTISNFGECEIKSIRIYNTNLKSSDILHNYVASIYDLDEQKIVDDRNNAAIPTVVFKRRKTSTNSTTFAILNSITNKAVSKKSCVDCVVEYNDGKGNIMVLDFVDVYLQGTSSLQYPIKNYKLKLFEDNDRKKKKKITMQDNWKPENTFTLKCDYMEGSHLNNTPTANYYQMVMAQIGAESPAAKNGYLDAVDGFPVLVYFTDDPDDSTKLTYTGSYMFNIDKSGNSLGFGAEVVDSDGNKFTDHLGNEIDNKCQSFEGVANSTDTAGCFYRLEDSIDNVYRYYVEDCYQKAYNAYLTAHNLTDKEFTFDQFKETSAYDEVEVQSYEDFVATYDELDYIATDFEPRYDYTEYEDLDDPTEEDKERCYGPIRDLVNWVSDTSKDLTRFKAEFKEHLNLNYCIGYYLQMIVFGQVDNAGKNSMWDTWDGKIWYPRPYDMDTQVGLSNTGTETINPDAELIPLLSPTTATGTFAEYTSNSVTELRYASYNTKTSRFWNSFGTVFAEDIKATYQSLRKTLYDIDAIMTTYKSLTSDIIGQRYYNKDMAAKYFTQTNSSNFEYLKMLHGNRLQRFKQWMTQRLVFCDTLFDYRYSEDNANSLNSEITLRSDAYINSGEESSTIKAYIAVATFTPQYVTVNVGSSRDAIITAYVGPNSTYVDPDSNRVMNGTLFTFPVKATDKEITISGAANIMYLNKIEDLNLRDLTIANATKILSLNLSSSSRMTRLIMGNNKYLRELNCRDSYLLGSISGGQVLDLTNCPNIQTVDITNTQITTINFASGGNLKQAVLSSSMVKNLSFDSLEFLESIQIDGCDNLTEYIIKACPKLTTVSVAGTPIGTFKAIDCTNLEVVNCSDCKALETFELTGCDNINTLNMTNNTGKMMNDLMLYTLYDLTTLQVNNSSTLKNIRFPKYESKEEADRIAELKLKDPTATDESLNAKLWHNLSTLNIQYSGIRWIQYGSDDITEANRALDTKQLTNLSSISFRGCTSITDIINLNYTARDCGSLFADCVELKSIQGYLKCTYSANSIFYNCKKLANLVTLTTDFAGCTSIAGAFSYCQAMSYTSARDFLHTCDGSLITANSLFSDKGTSPESTLPDDMFAKTPNITNLQAAFYNNYSITEIQSVVFRGLSKVTNTAQLFEHCIALKTVDSDIMSCFPNVTNAQEMFALDTELTTILTPTFFESNKKLQNIRSMFYNCNKMVPTGGITGLFDPLVALTNAKYAFILCRSIKGAIPNGFFAKNTALTDISGIFAFCSGLTTLPERLFRVNKTDTNNLNSLTQAPSVFYNCTALAGTVGSDFFKGAPNIISIGYINTDNVPLNPTTKIALYGFFGNTAINGYYDDFLHPLTKLQNAYGLFNHEASNANALSFCYYYDDNGVAKEYENTLSINLFDKNTMLNDARKIFRNCTGIRGCIPYKAKDGTTVSFFHRAKSTLRLAGEAFAGCTGLTGIDLDNSEIAGIKKELFAGFDKLSDVGSFFNGCTSYNMSFPEGIFEGCVSLSSTAYMFSGCTGLEGDIPASLFNSCRSKLQYVNYMFNGCTGLSSELPSGTYDENGNPIQKGLLADCIELISASYMFYNCVGITGGIPDDIFYTSVISNKYTKLTTIQCMFHRCTGLTTAYEDPVSKVKYLVNPDFLTKCTGLTTVSYAFGRLTSMEACTLHQTMFAKQVKLVDASGCFYGTRNLTGSITSTFMLNCITTLQNVYGLFAFTQINNVEEGFLHGTLKNSKLTTVGALFYNVPALTGNAPQFWNGNVFTAIAGSEQGYFGCIYNCTKLSNYAEANAVSTNWTKNVNIYI